VMVKVSMRSAESALVDEATPLKQHAELHPPAPRSAAIDGLRPLLALRVVLGHVSGGVTDSEPGYDSIRLFWTAAETSFVYFVLSGFVQGRSSRPHPVGARRRAVWFLARFLRLAPVYYTALFSFVLLNVLGQASWDDTTGTLTFANATDQCPLGHPAALPLHLLMLQSWWPLPPQSTPASWGFPYGGGCTSHVDGRIPMVFHLWFPSTLLAIYAIYGLLSKYIAPVSLGPRASLAAALIACVTFGMLQLKAVSSSLTNALYLDSRLELSPIGSLPIFLVGVYTGAFERSTRGHAFRAWRIWAVADSALVLACAIIFCHPEWPFGDFVAVGVLGPVFIFTTFCEQRGLIVRALSHPSLVSLAYAGYSVYCFQRPVVLLFRLASKGGPVAYPHGLGSKQSDEPMAFTSYILVLYAFAAAFESCVEAPLRARFERWTKALSVS